MSARDAAPPATEPTPQGDQVLIPGVAPVSARERLAQRRAMPLGPRKPQKPLDIGLFDTDRRNQLDLF